MTEVEQLRARLKAVEAELERLHEQKEAEIKRFEEDPTSIQNTLSAILDTVPHPVFWKDKNSVFQGCNAAFAAEIGLSQQDIIGKKNSDLTDEVLIRNLHSKDADVIESGRAIYIPEHVNSLQGGKKKLQAVSKEPLRDAGGNVIGMVGALRDLTELRIAERALNDSEKRFTAAFEYSASGMALIAASDGTWLQVNPAICEMLGYDRDELQGKTTEELTHPDDLKISLAARDRLVTGEVSSNLLEKRFLHKDGHEIWALVCIGLVRDEQDQPVYSVAQIQDISKRTQSDLDMEQMNQRLLDYSHQSGMAEVATTVLHNVGNVLNSINVSSSLAREKVRVSKVSELSRAVALLREHENDLPRFLSDSTKGTQLVGFLDRLSRYLLDEQQEIIDELECLQFDVEHVKEIISMQQAYTQRIGTSAMLDVSEMADVIEIVENSLRMLMHSLKISGIEVQREFDPVPLIRIEKYKVMQILVNLLHNAKFACNESKSAHKLLSLRVSSDDDWVKIVVIDNGIGIKRKNLRHVFDAGFTTKGDGLGVGLHSGALAAQEMGGTLSAHSDGPGKGAVFTLELPRNRETIRNEE